MDLVSLDPEAQQLTTSISSKSLLQYGQNSVNKLSTFPKRGSLTISTAKTTTTTPIDRNRDEFNNKYLINTQATNMTTNFDGTKSNLSVNSACEGGSYSKQQLQPQTARILVSKSKTKTGLPLLLKNSIN